MVGRRSRSRVRKFVRAPSKGTSDGGVRYAVNSHPNSFCAVPWYNLVVRIDSPPANVTTVTLQAAIASQLGVTFANALVNVRLREVRVWGAITSMSATSAIAPLSVTIFDHLAASTAASNPLRVLEVLIDYPDMVRRACVGYKFPKAQREVSLFLTNVTPTTLLSAQGLGGSSVIYYYLQWRSGSTTVTPALAIVPPLSEEETGEEDDYVDLEKLHRGQLYTDDDGVIRTLSSKFQELSS
jgi:hypothetical protein